jgi:tRNA 2-selenouridine synthase
VNRPSSLVTVDALDEFTDRIDTRTPAEFAEDHLPGATSHPVLSNEERARVGSIYKQESSFAAKKLGAAIISRNIADMLEQAFADQPRDWRPLVYCWRGGKRSAALVHVLNEIGWKAKQLAGGYKSYRRWLLARLEDLPAEYSYRVVCGLTGSGKSRLLQALEALGGQVLDLEALAAHRGSLLGDLPQAPQPSQKAFETRIVDTLSRFDRTRPVFLESESKRVGELRVPETLIAAMWASPCVRVEMDTDHRVALLKEEYLHFLQDPQSLLAKLDMLLPLHGRKVIEEWRDAVAATDWDHLVGDLLQRHYDPAYTRSMVNHYPRYAEARVLRARDHAPGEFARLAAALLGEERTVDDGLPVSPA